MERDIIIISGICIVTDEKGLGVFVEVPRVDGNTGWRRIYEGSPPCKCPTGGTLVQPSKIREAVECDPFIDEETPSEKG